MGRLIIEGSNRVKGEVTPSGNKNEALPALAACLLTDEEVTLTNLPRIRDVLVMCDVLADLGAEVEWTGEHSARIRARRIDKSEMDRVLCGRVRASILFAGPMVARVGRVDLPPPGGDVIGRRKLDTHFAALRSLGASLEVGDSYHLRADHLVGSEMFLDEASVTGTENALMAAVLARGTTVIENAACEPHVQGLCRMLQSMGASIDGIGTNNLTIEGVDRLHGATHRIGSDYLEVGSFMCLGGVMGDGLTIHDVVPRDLRKILTVFARMGLEARIEGTDCVVPGGQELAIQADMHGVVPQIDDAPWPQFPTDLMSIAIVTATQAAGTVLFFEKMYEGRMFFVDSLISMGASIILCDPHRVVVAGPSNLYASTLRSPDIRAGMALLIACLAASGRSVMHNVEQIDRGYEHIDDKLKAIGAVIERVEEGD
ncbi:MAG: UDP-N-acetylglucosamine 1-carboxyvinyltransferase [Deltaproteobacteria bacterium]|nr:UDP-N-acetylglucosamine 1-carboxyvinyltransferase [Deltaproteobacteria bacterium]